MAKLVIDLSGKGGLSDRFYGNLPYGSSDAQNIIINANTDNDYATGTVNPIVKNGYLSPANNSFTSVALVSSGPTCGATEIDTIKSYMFFLDRNASTNSAIRWINPNVASGAHSVASTLTIAPASGTATGTDLQFYSINGQRFLFASYKNDGASNGDILTWSLVGTSGTNINGTTRFLSYTNKVGSFAGAGVTVTGITSTAVASLASDIVSTTTTGYMILTGQTHEFTDAETLAIKNSSAVQIGTATAFITGGTYSSAFKAFLSTMPSGKFSLGNNQHRMVVADNGYMYILDGSAVHKFDGTTTGGAGGTVTSNVLLWPATFQLVDAIDWRGNLWIAAMQSTRDIWGASTNLSGFSEYAGVYVWDRKTSGTSSADFIPIPGIRDLRVIVDFGGVPTIFTVSSDRYTEIRQYNGSSFQVVKTLGPEAYPHFHDSVYVNGDMMIWLGNDGKIYGYGKITTNQTSNNLYMFGDITGQAVAGQTFQQGGVVMGVNYDGNDSTLTRPSTTGANVVPQQIYFSFLDTANLKIIAWYPHEYRFPRLSGQADGSNNFANSGNFKTKVFLLPKLSTIISATLYYPPISGLTGTSTAALYADLYFDQATTSWGQTSIYNDPDVLKGFKYWPVGKKGTNAVQVGLSWPTTIGLVSLPTPKYMEINYEEGTKRI